MLGVQFFSLFTIIKTPKALTGLLPFGNFFSFWEVSFSPDSRGCHSPQLDMEGNIYCGQILAPDYTAVRIDEDLHSLPKNVALN